MSSLTLDNKRFFQSDDGAALVEAALITPLFVLLLFGVLEISVYLWEWNAANKATQLGARLAVTSDPVATGPGLTMSPVTGSMGTSCRPGTTNPCYEFKATCDGTLSIDPETKAPVTGASCTISGATPGVDTNLDGKVDAKDGVWGSSSNAFGLILTEMRRTLPNLRANEVRITYQSNGLGFIGFPGHVPSNVTVEIIQRQHNFVALAGLSGWLPLSIRASSTLTSEDLRT